MVSGLLLFIGVLVGAGPGNPGTAAAAPPATVARLQTISPTGDRQVTSVVIEASDPVPYLTTHPNPLTLLVDLRNVSIEGLRNLFTSPRGAVAAVAVETIEALGAPVARIRVTLAREARFRVMAERNVIRVDIENAAPPAPVAARASAAPAPAPKTGAATAPNMSEAERRRVAALPIATKLHAVRAADDQGAVRLTLTGNGRVEPVMAERAKDLPPRFVLDFKGVASLTPKVIAVSRGPVQQIRIATHSSQPLVTRVVVDLLRWVEPRLERGLSGGSMALVFDETAMEAGRASSAPTSSGNSTERVVGAEVARPADEPTKAAPSPVPVPPMPAPTSFDRAQDKAAVVPETSKPVEAPKPAEAPAPPTVLETPAVLPVAPPPAPAPAPAAPAPQPQPAQAGQTPSQPSVPQPAQAGQQPAQPAGAQSAPTGERQYAGFPISLDFEGVDLQSVLRVFAQETGLNVVIDPAVQGSVNVHLVDVPWDQALDIILRANKLGWTLEGTIVRIAPLATLAEEEQAKTKLATALAESGDLIIRTRTLSYAKAAEIAPLLLKTMPASQRGSVEIDARTNTLIISDLEPRVTKGLALLDQLDAPQPQVEIEARIVQTNRTFAKEIGVAWGVTGRVGPELGNTTSLAFPNSGTLTGRTGATQGGINTPSVVNLGVTGQPTGAIGLQLGSVNGALNLDMALSALERSGKGRLLSAPRVTTQNNVEALMYQGVQIPIQTISNNTVTVTFKDAALSLKVTPQITAAGTVIMQVELENASPDFTRSVNGIPPIDTQRAISKVLVADGQTTVVGGVYLSREQASQDRVPGLGSVPILNWLFKREGTTEENRELLVFITPKIARPPAPAAATAVK